MSEDLSSTLFLIFALFIIFAVIFLIPQAVGWGVYRLVKRRALLLAHIAGFFAPLILFCVIVGYFWFSVPQASANELPGGEGDIVGPAIILFGLILNICGGAAFYLYLFVKNKVSADSGNH